ncbi:hypothetical protein V8G54_018193 [Vigna mungo]|uniref:Uncharacterized protein n=1 Tax=Vigna mungo TaxID=3915 RepID=A0AAQ3RSH1_VIGMU
MARSFTNVKVLSALVVDRFSNTTTRYTNCFSFFFLFNYFFCYISKVAVLGFICGGVGLRGYGDGDTKRNQRRCLHRRQYGSKIRRREGNTNEIDLADLRAMVLGKTFNHYFPVPVPPLINLKSQTLIS